MSKVIAKVTIEAGQGKGKTLTLDFLERMFQAHGVTVTSQLDGPHETFLWVEGDALLFTPAGKAATHLAIEQAVTSVIGPDNTRLRPVASKFDHVLKVCAATCTGCQFCDGDLKYCEVCHGGEGDLPTECPGRAMVDSEMMDIADNKLDFVAGKWVTKGKSE